MTLHHQPAPDASKLIEVGQLKKPYGIKGWLWVFSNTDNRADVFDFVPWWIKTATGYRQLTVLNWRQQGAGLVAQFEEVPDRTIAETMYGVKIWAQKEHFAETGSDEYYWSDLVGLSVINTNLECLGRVKGLFETGAHPIIEVEPSQTSIDEASRLIPWHKQTIIDVFLDKQEIHVDWEADF